MDEAFLKFRYIDLIKFLGLIANYEARATILMNLM